MLHAKRWVRLAWVATAALLGAALSVSCSANEAGPGQQNGGSSSSASGTGGLGTGGNMAMGGSAAQCAVACGATQTCTNGACTCPAPLAACGQACVNTNSDVANCGMCGTVCSSGQICSGGCMCQAGLSACSSGCVNVSADGANCGGCGMPCPAATPLCSSSMCVASCPAGQMQCGTGCRDAASFQTDPLNCGACGKACAAGQSCTAGVCGCPAGQTNCNGSCVDLQTDISHCGSCDKTCSGGAACAGGTCGCAASQTSCGAMCVDTMTSSQHCGGCDKPCAAGSTCQGGQCMTGGGGTRPAGCPAAASLLSDFEEGSGVLVKQGGRDGWWYVYADTSAGSQTPPSSSMAIAASLLSPPAGDCNKYAMHSTASGHAQYVGFGATLSPGASAATKKAVSLETYTGVSFRVRSGSGNAPPIWFELLNKETQPADLSGTAKNDQVDAYNTRGRLLEGIGTDWKTFTLPFSTLAPRYLPSGCAAGVMCEAPSFNSKSVLGLQFSLYDQFDTGGKYDLWVDDVNLTSGDAGVPTYTQSTGNKPFPRDAALANGCLKPTGASGKQLIEAYLNWKKTFVVSDGNNLRVKSPEIDNGATVSEGIAYGMLIAVFMNDKPLFDGLLGYWKAHPASGLLMNWKIPGGSGSATDSDEDAAFALIQASKQWGGTYLDDAKSLLSQIAASDIESGSNALKPGNQFGGASLTNPSYFAPAYYRLFATVDTGNASKWNAVLASTYEYLNKIEGSSGLVPAWCSNGCASRGGGSYADNDKYQYDAHRAPWRMALDVCWNGNADAKDYVNKVTSTFVGKTDTEGLGALADIYDGSGNSTANSKPNSMSIVGTAAVGAMATGNASNQAFVNRAYQFLLDASYNGDPTFKAEAYTYYNATVGLLTALTLTGNFNSL